MAQSMDQANGYAVAMEVTRGTGSTALTSATDTDFNTGLVISQTDPRDKETTYTYDAAQRADVITASTGATSDAGYNDSALTATQSVTYTEGGNNKTVTTTYTYDGWGRVVSTVDPNNGQVNMTYDAMGRMWKQTNPFQAGQTPGAQTVNTFDALGRTTLVTLPDSNTVQTSYSGATVTVTDQVNRKMKRETDGLGRLIKVTEQDVSTGNLTQETSYSYDLMDKLTEVNQGTQYRRFKFDSLGRMLFEKIPEMTATINDGTGTYWTTKYVYTDFNAISTKTDARGVINTYSYDSANRMTGVSYNVSGASGVASTPSVTYTYDTGTSSATKGLPLSVSISGQSSESYSYDGDNQLSGVTRTIGTKTYTTSYQKTTAGQLTQLTYPSNRVLNLNHDSTGRLSSIVNNGDSTNYLSSLSYNYAGQTTGQTLGSNIAETFGYDSNRLQLTSQTVTQNGSTRMSLAYNYSATSGQNGTGSTAGNSGQLMSISGTIGGITESAAYTYDLSHRLVTSNQTTNSVSAQRRFIYDRWGNRTSVYDATSGGSQIQSIALEQTSSIPTNRISSVTTNGGSPVSYTYDSNGNVTNDGAYSYQYDAENRLVSVNSGTTASYSYDHQNRRIQKVVGSTTTHYVWEGNQCIAEHNGSTGAVLTDYIYSGSRMIAREQSGNRHFFLYDRLGARATITDGQGGIQGRQATLPFGEELNATGTTDKHRFTSYERDAETDTDYAVNRQYNQSIGRFNRVDPMSGSLTNPQSLNRYAYAQSDPINNTDPSGLTLRVFCGIIGWNPGDGPGVTSEYTLGCHGYDDGFGNPDNTSVSGDSELSFWVKYLIDALNALPEKCKQFLGTQSSIDNVIKDIKSGALPLSIVDSNSPEADGLIPHAPNGLTFRQYWNNIPGYSGTIAYTVNYNNQAQPYNSIILGPLFHRGVQHLLDMVGGDHVKFKNYSLVHELMHVLNDMGDQSLFKKWTDEGAILSGGMHPSQALYKFFADGCPTKE